jgi:fatty acid desaturase
LATLARAESTAAYARLKATIVAQGILDRSYRFYAALCAFAFGGFAVSAWAIFSLESYGYLALACLAFSFFSVQLGGLMHDCGHRAVFSRVGNNDVLGYVCAALLGMVFDNWKSRHNAHHAHPNQEDLDPDMEIPFIATSDELYRAKGGFQRWLVRYQAFYYYPLGAIVSFSNRLGSITYFLKDPSARNLWKFSIWGAGVAVLFVSPFVVFPLEKAAFVFGLVHVSSGVYLMNCFAPNHKAMPQVGKDEVMSFFEQQVITSRNVRGGFLTDLMLVGLNYQIEHHLFPSTPRNKLKLLKPHVEAACRELGVEYTESGFIETNRVLVRALRDVTRSDAARPVLESAAG